MQRPSSVCLRCQFRFLQRSLKTKSGARISLPVPSTPPTIRYFSQRTRPSIEWVPRLSLGHQRRKSLPRTRALNAEADQQLLPQKVEQWSQDGDVQAPNIEGSEGSQEDAYLEITMENAEEDITEEVYQAGEASADAEEGLEHLTLADVSPEGIAYAARQRFGDRLPTGLLSEGEYKIYERNYGPPLGWDDPATLLDDEQSVQRERSTLLKEGEGGMFEEVEITSDEAEDLQDSERKDEAAISHTQTAPLRQEQGSDQNEPSVGVGLATAMKGLVIEDLRSSDQHQLLSFSTEPTPEAADDDPTLRTHPFTQMARSRTNPSTLFLPKETLIDPIAALLSEIPNKHIDEASERVFGGPFLPYATGTPGASRTMPQKPIPLTTAQSKMSSMEANVFMAVLMPGIYATATSTLVEVRRRLGSGWIQRLLRKPGGPRMLDVGGAGAAVLAWREVLRAEWSHLHSEDGSPMPHPIGKATVLTGSQQLQRRASSLLDNTTFLPRIPDYVNAGFEEGEPRKQFDVIVASHSLWRLQSEQDRRAHVENLWSLLNPDGGVLIFAEKGVPRGFEVIANARQQLLDEIFTPPAQATEQGVSFSRLPKGETYSGSIIAPCTTHSKCPMYPTPGISRQRKDYCHFQQRYIRPHFYQRILGAKDRNHEDVPFSYIAVQKGVAAEDLVPQQALYGPNPFQGRRMGKEARDRAFEGYETTDPDIAHARRALNRSKQTPHLLPNPHALPRLVYTPLKRHGHVILDLCTPSGELERWTVPRSFGKQAHRDARKAEWGDLWALGAETSVPRNVRLGKSTFAEDNAGQGSAMSTTAYRNMKEALGEDEKGLKHRDVFLTEGKKAKKFRGREKARRRKREERKLLLVPRKEREKAAERLEESMMDGN